MCWVCARRLAPALLLVLAACGGDQASPDQQVRAVIAAMEEAVETASLQRATGLLHPDYRDGRHPNKAAAARSLFAYLQRHSTIHLFTLTKSVDLSAGGDRARAIVYVAMTGVPVDSVDMLVSLKADLYRFDIDLAAADGGWSIVQAHWQRADLAVL